MTTRRDFLRGGATAAAGLVFCGCGLLHRANAQQPARQTLPVKVAGKTVKTIDVHFPLSFPRGRRAARRRCRQAATAAGQWRVGSLHRDREAARRDGLAGRRHGGALDQPVLVRPRSRSRRENRQDPEREARRALRLEAGPVRGLRFAHAAGARSCGAGTRNRREEAGIEGRGDRRRRQWRGVLRSEIQSGLGQGGRARRSPVHPSAGRRRAQQAAGRQWLARQHHWESFGARRSRCRI